ncbi:hypothetical protein ElyMa_004872000 [Elysia marginata]|uniref:Uncharacterized protein n=1 Tax=Elysia marginata TaxID=1093978 RepID=A0AAV4IRY3_9GAST|nr:hypothetical protein ElyMa_004872000 [Elysia marginata]
MDLPTQGSNPGRLGQKARRLLLDHDASPKIMAIVCHTRRQSPDFTCFPPQQIQLKLHNTSVRLLGRYSNTYIPHTSGNAFSQVPILQVNGLG